MSYAPQEKLTDPARPSSGLGRLLLGCVGVLAGSLLIGPLLLIPILSLLPAGAGDFNSPLGTLIALASFILMIAALTLVLRFIHNRGLLTLVGHPSQALQDFIKTLKGMAILYAVFLVVPGGGEAPAIPNLPFGTWVLLLAPALIAIFIQVSAEELLFRGYLQSQLAATARSPIVWLGVPSFLFGLLHGWNTDDPQGALIYIAITFVLGLMLGDLTARTGTLGPAIAIHLVNNTMGILILGNEGLLDGLALYVIPVDGPFIPPLWPSLLSLLCVWLTARIALRV
ncbi:CPBP family intramembrane glutamic endopeptidase [Aestuariibius insulae]|uniref:CPBP family intramembrane glutamic endopeptidase n=1 Tax=Aestuariibius insulae TaxID=2058287 RepID=UPI00398EC399